MDIRWALLLPTSMIVLFLVLGYTLDGTQGLRDHYYAEVNNVPVILALSILWFVVVLILIRSASARPTTLVMRRVRTR